MLDGAARLHRFLNTDTFPTNNSTGIHGSRANYSKALNDLVTRCLRTNPKDRPSFLELRIETKAEIDKLEGTFGQFKDMEADQLPAHMKVIVQLDAFAVGTRAIIPRKRRRESDYDPVQNERDGVGGVGYVPEEEEEDDDSNLSWSAKKLKKWMPAVLGGGKGKGKGKQAGNQNQG